MMREHQVIAACLDIEPRSEEPRRDRGALDMPAGPARAERGWPGRLPWPLANPHEAVERILLSRAPRVAATLGEQPQHRLGRETRQGAERRIGGSCEIQVGLEFVQ